MFRRLWVLVMLCFLGWCPAAWGHPLDTLQPGTWMEIPSSTMQAVLYPYPPGVPHGSGFPIGPESGAAYDTTRDRLVVFGGGHGDSADNALYAFDLNTLQWSRLNDPALRTDPTDTLQATGYYPDANGQPDLQQPRAGHSYNLLQYVPALDRVCTFGTAVLWNNGQRALMQTLCFDQQTRLWERKAPPLTARIGSWTVLDLVTGHIWQHGTIVNPCMAEYDPVADTWTKRSGNYGQYEYYTTAAIDPIRRQLVVVPGCRGSGLATCPSMPAGYTFDLSQSGLLTPQSLSMVGAEAIATGVRNPGLDYDPVSGSIVAWNGGADVYTLDMATRTWTRVPPAPGNTVVPTNPAATGTYGRWRYSPRYNVFIVVNSVKQNVFAYRLRWQ